MTINSLLLTLHSGSGAPPAPVNTVAPVITSGTLDGDSNPINAVGATYTCTTGTWTNSPTAYHYDWKRDGVTLGATDQNTYVTVSGGADHNLTCAVTASNGASSSPATSNALYIRSYLLVDTFSGTQASGTGNRTPDYGSDETFKTSGGGGTYAVGSGLLSLTTNAGTSTLFSSAISRVVGRVLRATPSATLQITTGWHSTNAAGLNGYTLIKMGVPLSARTLVNDGGTSRQVTLAAAAGSAVTDPVLIWLGADGGAIFQFISGHWHLRHRFINSNDATLYGVLDLGFSSATFTHDKWQIYDITAGVFITENDWCDLYTAAPVADNVYDVSKSDHEIQLQIVAPAGSVTGNCGFYYRYLDANNWWWEGFEADTWKRKKNVAGSVSDVITQATAIVAGATATLNLSAIGSSMVGQVLRASDTTWNVANKATTDSFNSTRTQIIPTADAGWTLNWLRVMGDTSTVYDSFLA